MRDQKQHAGDSGLFEHVDIPLVELRRIELLTSSMRTTRSPQLSYSPVQRMAHLSGADDFVKAAFRGNLRRHVRPRVAEGGPYSLARNSYMSQK